jgi:hypothetical protein
MKLSVYYAEYHIKIFYTVCHYAECHNAEGRGAPESLISTVKICCINDSKKA